MRIHGIYKPERSWKTSFTNLDMNVVVNSMYLHAMLYMRLLNLSPSPCHSWIVDPSDYSYIESGTFPPPRRDSNNIWQNPCQQYRLNSKNSSMDSKYNALTDTWLFCGSHNDDFSAYHRTNPQSAIWKFCSRVESSHLRSHTMSWSISISAYTTTRLLRNRCRPLLWSPLVMFMGYLSKWCILIKFSKVAPSAFWEWIHPEDTPAWSI